MNNITETDKAYLAGIIDGEGCINVTEDKQSTGIRVEVGSTDPRVIDWIYRKTGIGSVRVPPDTFR